MNFTGFVLFVLAATFSKTFVDATVCTPRSILKIDCNECHCNEAGSEYSCTIKQCETAPIANAGDKDNYVIDLDDSSKPDDHVKEQKEFSNVNTDKPSSNKEWDYSESESEGDDKSSNNKELDSSESGSGSDEYEYDDESDDEEDISDYSGSGSGSGDGDLWDSEDHRKNKRGSKRYIKGHGKRYVRPHIKG